jgi:hypothetical protein
VQDVIQRFIAGDDRFEQVEQGLELRLKLKGEKWKGVFNKSIARFLIELDGAVEKELQRNGVDVQAGQDGLVVLRIEEGSLEAFLEFGPKLLKAFRKMTPREQITLSMVLLAAIGVWKSDAIIDSLNKPEIDKIASQEKVEMIKEVVQAVNENTRELQKPMRSLIKTMDENDTIILPGMEKDMKAEMAADELVKGTRSAKKNFYIDHPYIVQALSTKNPNNWTITLKYGEVSFVAKLQLTEDEMKTLLKDFQEAHSKGQNIAPDLHINAEITSKGVKSASVVSMGKPRALSKSLAIALKEADALPKLKQ